MKHLESYSFYDVLLDYFFYRFQNKHIPLYPNYQFGFKMKKIVQILGIVTLAVALTGCYNLSRTQKNTAIGAAVGGVAGNVIGGSTGATLGGAALGGLIGSQVGK